MYILLAVVMLEILEQHVVVPPIPPQTFVPTGQGQWAKNRVGYAGVEEVITDAETALGVSGWQLARLLGSNFPSPHLNQWKNGRTGMGSLYMARLVKLYHLKFVKGMDLCYYQRIDWDTGQMYLRRKNGHKNTLPTE
jgi:hypothetical protein